MYMLLTGIDSISISTVFILILFLSCLIFLCCLPWGLMTAFYGSIGAFIVLSVFVHIQKWYIFIIFILFVLFLLLKVSLHIINTELMNVREQLRPLGPEINNDKIHN